MATLSQVQNIFSFELICYFRGEFCLLFYKQMNTYIHYMKVADSGSKIIFYKRWKSNGIFPSTLKIRGHVNDETV